MRICENCSCEHDGSYGSGRFCSSNCARGFSTKAKRKEINEVVSIKLKELKKHIRKFCSVKCSGVYSNAQIEKREMLSLMMKDKAKNGLLKGWSSRNKRSYPELFFEKVLQNNNLLMKCVIEKRIPQIELGINNAAGYFLDFYFEDKKIDLEIDGFQHSYRQESDNIRDLLLSEKLGIKVYRIKWKNINTQKGKDYIKEEIDKFLDFYKNN